MPTNNKDPQVNNISSSIPMAHTTVPDLLTTNAFPKENTIYKSTYSYSSSPIASPKIISHNEYKYNSSNITTKTYPFKTSNIKTFDHPDVFFYDTVLPVQTTTNNIFEVTPAQEELSKITYHPKLEIYSTESFVILMMDLPGLSKENLTVELEKGLLKIFGKKNKPHVEELTTNNEYHTKIVERLSEYYFHKVFKMPCVFWESQNISCKLKDGELIIKILANEVKNTKKIIDVE